MLNKVNKKLKKGFESLAGFLLRCWRLFLLVYPPVWEPMLYCRFAWFLRVLSGSQKKIGRDKRSWFIEGSSVVFLAGLPGLVLKLSSRRGRAIKY